MLSVHIKALADADYAAVGHMVDMMSGVVDMLVSVATVILGRGIPAGRK